MKKGLSFPKITALIALIWRELLFVPLFFSKYIPFREGYGFTTLWGYADSYAPVASRLLYPWANFDGVHYLTIAGQGYTDNMRFMPLYPLFIGLFNLLTGNRNVYGPVPFFAALILSNLFLAAALFLLYKLVRLDYKDNAAVKSVIALILFPTAFFLGSVYSESLFLLLCIASFYSARKRKWWLAGLMGALASATRIVGIVLLPALFIEYLLQKKKDLRQLAGIALAPLGTLAYMVYNFLRWGNPLKFIQAQGELANGRATASIVLPPQTIYRYFRMLLGIAPAQWEWKVVILEFAAFCFALFLLWLIWKQKMRWSYIAFACFGFLVPVLSGTFTGLPRYVLPLFPLFISLGLVKNRFLYALYVAAGIILSAILLMFFARGYYIA